MRHSEDEMSRLRRRFLVWCDEYHGLRVASTLVGACLGRERGGR